MLGYTVAGAPPDKCCPFFSTGVLLFFLFCLSGWDDTLSYRCFPYSNFCQVLPYDHELLDALQGTNISHLGKRHLQRCLGRGYVSSLEGSCLVHDVSDDIVGGELEVCHLCYGGTPG